MPAHAVSKPVKRKNGQVEVYGLLVPEGMPEIAVELLCYRTNRGPDKGGLGAHEHFKRAFRLMWPKYEWSEWVEKIVWAFCTYKWVIVIGHERASKCLGKGTPVMLYDGTILPVEDVKEGMMLMGDDSTPRRVLSLARGREPLYSVKASRGSTWVCNESHILSFKCSRDLRHRNGHLTHRKGDLIDLPLTEFKKKGIYWRSIWKQYQVGVDFPDSGFTPPFDPYIYGAWLADGGFDTPSFCKPDGPMAKRWMDYWSSMPGYRVHCDPSNARCLHQFARYDLAKTNPFTDFIRTSTASGEKRILRSYLTASREIRASLLAGLLDGDGCAQGNKFAITTKYPGLAKDIQFLARSLGFYASEKKKIGKIKSRGFEAEYRSVYVSGDFTKLPTIQKSATSIRSNDPLCQSVAVKPIGEGDFYGFELDGNRRFLLGDFTVTHNTFTMAHCAFLDYCADPQNTLTSLATVTFEGLKLRMWADMQRAVETAKGMPVETLFNVRSTTNELRLFPKESSREAAEKFQIHGIAVTQSKDAEGRIRGGHAPRRRIFLDEAQNIADPIYQAVINPMSAPDAKAILLTNPVEKVSKFGEWCEPEGGWASVSDTDLFWPLKKFKDGICLHFDGLQSPNIKAGESKFTGLLTLENVDEVRRVHGEDSVQWWSLIRGWFPPDGMVSRVFPSAVIEKGKPPIIFDFQPMWCASLDPAFEFDSCAMHFGELGHPVFGAPGLKINCKESMKLKLSAGPGSEPKDYQIAHIVMRECKVRGVQPKHFIMDGTGGGRGVVAILQKEWSTDIQVVNYGGAATDRPIRWDNAAKASDHYLYFVTELYFRAAEYVRDGLIGGISNLDTKTEEDLYARRYSVKQGSRGTLSVVETKVEMKKRLGRSPDDGDAFVQLAELLCRLGTFVGHRVGSQLTVSGKWDRSRDRAKLLGNRHSEEKEFAY